MRIERRRVGTTRGHAGQGPRDVDEYTLDTGDGLSVAAWTYGATLVEARVPDRAGRAANVVLRLPGLSDYEDRRRNPYVGATMGRFARCVAEGRFSLDGREHRLDRNMGRHHFHGGSLGFDRYVWEAEAGEEDGRLVLRLRLESPDGDQGYPGALSAETVYAAGAGATLAIEHRATTSAPTIVGLTSHAFWNLAGRGTVDGHRLAVNAARVLPADEELIPTGPPRPVAGTRLDLAAPRPLAGLALDHCFALDDPAWAAELLDPASGRGMRVSTDQPGLAVYSGDHLAAPRAGICLQTGGWPDAPNHAGFPSARLDPGGVYRHRTAHRFFAE